LSKVKRKVMTVCELFTTNKSRLTNYKSYSGFKKEKNVQVKETQ